MIASAPSEQHNNRYLGSHTYTLHLAMFSSSKEKHKVLTEKIAYPSVRTKVWSFGSVFQI